jgi:hypothetical protein
MTGAALGGGVGVDQEMYSFTLGLPLASVFVTLPRGQIFSICTSASFFF